MIGDRNKERQNKGRIIARIIKRSKGSLKKMGIKIIKDIDKRRVG